MQEKVPINRPLVGILALVCLGAGATIFFIYRGDESSQMWQAGFTRVGLVMVALWLALPSRKRNAAWANVSWTTFIGLILALFAVARFKWAVIPAVLVIAVVGSVLRPREKRRPGTRAD